VVHRINKFIASSLAFGCYVGCHRRIFVAGLLFLSTSVDVNPDRPDRHGQTPRLLAVSSSHPGVVALLSPLASAAPGTA